MLLGLWAAFLTLGGIAFVFFLYTMETGERTIAEILGLIIPYALPPILVLLVLYYLAWRYELLGGILLILLAIPMVFFSFSVGRPIIILLAILLAMPPLISGVLLIFVAKRLQRAS